MVTTWTADRYVLELSTMEVVTTWTADRYVIELSTMEVVTAWTADRYVLELSTMEVVTTWTADRYMTGFLPTPRFSQSDSVQILKTNPSDETVNPVPQCVYARRKLTYVKDHVVHVRVG